MNKYFYTLLLIAFTLLSTGCKDMSLSGVSFFQGGRSYSDDLEYGYGLLAEYEAFVREDMVAADSFYEKQAFAKQGQDVSPDVPVKSRLSAGQFTEMSKARNKLIHAQGQGTRGANSRPLAEAQLNYDCWLERAQDKERSGAMFCREKFYEAFGKVQIKEKSVPAAVKTTSLLSSSNAYSVYFGKSKVIPDDESMLVIKKIADTFSRKRNSSLYLTGRADSSGDKQANLLLSMRRALAVRNALAQNGVDLNNIVITAAGEGGVDIDGDRKNPNYQRRVDIVIESSSIDHSAEEKRMKTIAPHYFD